jgi:hypothetical protein
MTRHNSLGRHVVSVTHRQPEPTRNYRFDSEAEAVRFVKAITKAKPSELTSFRRGERTLTSPNGEVTVSGLGRSLV